MNHGDRTLPAPAVSEAEAAPRWTAPSPFWPTSSP